LIESPVKRPKTDHGVCDSPTSPDKKQILYYSPMSPPEKKFIRNEARDYNLIEKEDYLNFSIEKVWNEMAELDRARQSANDLFNDF